MTSGIAPFGALYLISAALSSLMLRDPLWLVSTAAKILSVSAYDAGAQSTGGLVVVTLMEATVATRARRANFILFLFSFVFLL